MDRECSYEDAAIALKCSETKVRDFVDGGQIRIVRRDAPAEKRGRVWLNAEDVEHVQRTWKRARRAPDRSSPATDRRIDGHIAALAYRQFDAGASDAAVVVSLELDPLLVRRLRGLYNDTPERQRLEREERDRRAAEEKRAKDHDRKVRFEARERIEVKKAEIAAQAAIDAADRAARIAARAQMLGARKDTL